jgi:hypothetical protein
MMRSIIISIFFFFGPALMMFVIRRAFLIARVWLRLRRLHKQQETDVIDITPHKHASPSMLFNVAAIIVGLTCAFLAWQEMNSTPEGEQRYIPAYVNEEGKIIPGKMVPVEKPAMPAN